ncbi:MAG: lipid-transfer protein, partial [Deltaproteobacteria bacterium]|nr:lipid-transfer protein [Deltaproteobacteria bacterium]
MLAEEIGIVAYAQTPCYRSYPDTEPSMLMGLVNQILEETGLDRHQIDFTIAGSSDYLSGSPFCFIANVDGFGAWPPVYESHVEMDGAWALFEA